MGRGMFHSRSDSHEGRRPSRQTFFGKSANKSLQKKEVAGFFQAKLAVNEPGDKYEKEADSMANHVVNSLHEKSPTQLQLKCKECEEEEKLQPRKFDQGNVQLSSIANEDNALKKEQNPEEEIQLKAESDHRAPSTSLSSRLANAKDHGSALPSGTKKTMEHSFGADFSNVSIHTDSNAVQMTKELQAQAFTHGNDIYFNQGKFDPASFSGKHLLAHELTHVIQQQGTIQRQPASVNEGSFIQTKNEDDNFLAGYTQCDFLDDRISFEAQFALYHLYKRGGNNRKDALSILGAVKDDRMQGVYKEDQGKPALMAQRHGIGWWQLIPKGQGALVFEPEEPPMMVFKNNIANNRAALADALQAAWLASSVAQQSINIPPPSLKPCPLIPSPEPEPEPEPEQKECPPGTIHDPLTDLCILDLPGPIITECTDAEMEREFQKQEDFCASIKIGLDLACNLGANPCDLSAPFGRFGPVGKLVCQIFTDDPTACSQPRSEFFEKCIVSTIIGQKDSMPCNPGSGSQIQSKYRRWPGREQ